MASFFACQMVGTRARLNSHRVALVLAAYGVLTILFTYPVALNILTKPAGSTDVYEYVWELWWAKRSVIDLHADPANVTALYHPYGTHHPVLWLDTYVTWTSVPLVTLFGPIAAYNMHFLSSHVLTGFTTYLLCYSLTKRHWPSFIGGTIFAFSPFRLDRAAHGVLSMDLTYWLPLYVLFLLKAFSRPSIRNSFFCAIFLALSTLSSFLHAAHFVVPVTAVFLLYQHFANRRRLYDLQFLKAFGLTLVIAGLIVIPFYAPVLKARMEGELEYFARFGILSHSAPLLGFVVPPPSHLVVERVETLRLAVEQILPQRHTVVYLGIGSLSLALWGARNRRTRLWVILAVLSAVLALGPLLRLGRELLEYSVAGRSGFVLLPGALLTRLPFYEWVRNPARFGELTIFSVALLASYGVTALLGGAGRRTVRLGATAALVMLVPIEYACYLPFPRVDLPTPEFYEAVATDIQDYGVLDVGTATLNHRGMYYQTVHGHPIVRGHIYRLTNEVKLYLRFMDQLLQPEPDIVNHHEELIEILKGLNIRYVVLHKTYPRTVEKFVPYLTQAMDDPVYEDELIAAFAVPTGDGLEVRNLPLLVLGEQWHPMESIDGAPSRWIVNDATAYVRVETEGRYRLSLVAHPFREPRHLQIFVNEEQIEEYHVGGLQSYVTPPFALPGGQWTPVRFHVPEGCEVPSEVMNGYTDDRCLSMLFQHVDILPVESQT